MSRASAAVVVAAVLALLAVSGIDRAIYDLVLERRTGWPVARR